MAFLDTIDENKPDGATEAVSVLDNYEREMRDKTKQTVNVEHHLTGEHKIPTGDNASRPAAGKAGRWYNNTQTKTIQRDDGVAWGDLILYYQRYKVGTFTGDGGNNRAVTGIGFQPTALWIYPVSGSNPSFFKGVNFAAGDSHKHDDGTTATNGIDSLDADGFTVDVGANVNTVVYQYVAVRDVA